MRKNWLPVVAVCMGIYACVSFGQIKHTSVPIGDAVDKALKKTLLTGEDARPFHIKITVSEPENRESPYQGTIEEWWESANKWRREVTAKNGMRQTIVFVDGKKTEKDEGEYFPLWLRNVVTAVLIPCRMLPPGRDRESLSIRLRCPTARNPMRAQGLNPS
jgi:hypothetical protein